MNDTKASVEVLFQKMMMEKSGQERMKMGFSMFDFARRQVIASIQRKNQNIDIKDLKRELFLRFYGQDFSSEEQEKILRKLYPQFGPK
ncbi:MAG: hypothetical protein KGJ87_07600 [Planctomycetota bacterium]|nr:hypothetical protein [Planctomycetota bacterium]MDE1890544.1 hypothetical protein [Planctomycetota bacterium]MDE2217003.1 hypothetical protein [Planctomycetota bacterium]